MRERDAPAQWRLPRWFARLDATQRVLAVGLALGVAVLAFPPFESEARSRRPPYELMDKDDEGHHFTFAPPSVSEYGASCHAYIDTSRLTFQLLGVALATAAACMVAHTAAHNPTARRAPSKETALLFAHHLDQSADSTDEDRINEELHYIRIFAGDHTFFHMLGAHDRSELMELLRRYMDLYTDCIPATWCQADIVDNRLALYAAAIRDQEPEAHGFAVGEVFAELVEADQVKQLEHPILIGAQVFADFSELAFRCVTGEEGLAWEGQSQTRSSGA